MRDDRDVTADVLVARQRRLLRILTGLLVVALVGLVVASWFAVDRTDPWNPLGPFPQQTVLNVGHTVRPGESVEVVGTKCVRGDRTVTVSGTGASWQLLSPSGSLFRTGASGVLTLGPGCVTSRFQNVPPAVVVARVAELCETSGSSVWVITGRVTPFRDEGEGVARTWTTDPFKMRCTA